jgi:Tfp pilus assembly protein PilO
MQLLEKLKANWNLNRREKILITIFLLLFLVFIYYKFFLSGQIARITQLRNEIYSNEMKINNMIGKRYDNPGLLIAETNYIEEDFKKIYQRVPGNPDKLGLLVYFSRSIKRHNLNAPDIIFSRIIDKGDYSSFTISFDVVGGRFDIYSFIDEIENFPRLCRIREIELIPLDSLNISAKMKIEFYILNEVKSDPLEYPFMNIDDTDYPSAPFSRFKIVEQKKVVTDSGVSDNIQSSGTKVSTEINTNSTRRLEAAGEENSVSGVAKG